MDTDNSTIIIEVHNLLGLLILSGFSVGVCTQSEMDNTLYYLVFMIQNHSTERVEWFIIFNYAYYILGGHLHFCLVQH